jgi:hypothetical protein
MIFLNKTNDLRIRISNVSLFSDVILYAFVLDDSDNINLQIVNTYISSLYNNVLVKGGTLNPRIGITNSILISGNKSEGGQWANITTRLNFESGPGIPWFNGIWNFENVRFVSYGNIGISNQRAHILSITFDSGEAMYVTLSNCKFWMSSFGEIDIWKDDSSGGGNTLEIVGPSLANSNSVYSSPGSVIDYLGVSGFIITNQDIINPSIIGM